MIKIRTLTVVAVALMLVSTMTAAAKDDGSCKVKITGGVEREFICRAELRDLNGWILVLGGSSSLPVDFGEQFLLKANR